MTVVEAVKQAWSDWQVDSVGVVDPSSPSATLVEPLQNAGMPLKLADSRGMAVAHARFRDLLDADRLRVRGHQALDEAVRLAQERRLSGAFAVERYGGPDMAPLVASELACWALEDDPDGQRPGIWSVDFLSGDRF
jgi:hypothetical protein